MKRCFYNLGLPLGLTHFRVTTIYYHIYVSSRWRHDGHDGVSNHQPHDCLLNRLFRRRSKKTSKLRVTGLCAGNSPGTGEFPTQMANNAENVSIWWRHHDVCHAIDNLSQINPAIIYDTNFTSSIMYIADTNKTSYDQVGSEFNQHKETYRKLNI